MGWIPLLSNRVALCQLTLTLRDSNNGNLSALPPHQLKHLSHTKPWEGLMPEPATAPRTCWMEVSASTTHTWGAQWVLCTFCPPPPQGCVPPACLGQAWPCSWRPGEPHCTPFMHHHHSPSPAAKGGGSSLPLGALAPSHPSRHPGDPHPGSGYVAHGIHPISSVHLGSGGHRVCTPSNM